MFMRRGCLFGCAGWLLACVAAGMLIWFVAIPRFTGAIEQGISEGVATMIAQEIDSRIPRSQLQQGGDVRFSFDTINRSLRNAAADENVESLVITSSGNQLVIRAEIAQQEIELAFVPGVTSDGKLDLEPVGDSGWIQQQTMGVLGGGFESAINEWLNRNDLRLVDVSLEGDTLILNVTGN